MAPYRNSPTKRCTLRDASVSAPTATVVLHTVLLILLALFALPWVQGAWAGPPTDQLRDGVERVVKILRDPALSGDTKLNERSAAVNKVADEIFDFGETAKRSLGQHWAQRTPAEREEFVRLFTELLQRTYISKVDQYNSEMTFQDDVVDGSQAVVRTTLLLGKGGRMSLDYRMHRPGTAGRSTTSASTESASWRVTDHNSTRSSEPIPMKPWWQDSDHAKSASRRPQRALPEDSWPGDPCLDGDPRRLDCR